MKREDEIRNNIRDFYGLIRNEFSRMRGCPTDQYRIAYVLRSRKAIAAQRAELRKIEEVKAVLRFLDSEASMCLDDIKLGKATGPEVVYETLLSVIPRLLKIIDRE